MKIEGQPISNLDMASLNMSLSKINLIRFWVTLSSLHSVNFDFLEVLGPSASSFASCSWS